MTNACIAEERRQGKNIAPSEAKSIQDELNPASLGNSKRGKAAAGLKVNKKNTKGKKWGKTTAEPQKQAENITTGTTSESADQIEAQDVGGDEDTQAQKVIEGVQEPEPHQNVGVIDGTFAPTLAPNEGRRNAAQETDVAIERSPAARAQVHDQGKTFLELLVCSSNACHEIHVNIRSQLSGVGRQISLVDLRLEESLTSRQNNISFTCPSITWLSPTWLLVIAID